MCGICGIVSTRVDAEASIRAMSDRLRHRGPDAEGFARLQHAQLGHRRLSIIDLSPTGAQPLWDSTRSVCVVYNGEIYNFRELRKECVARGSVFLGTSDTEVLVNLYLLDGERAFNRLDGMFAFCLIDARTGVTWLVRDPLGVKPLYYTVGSQGVFFASELGALVESGVVAPEVDEDALRAYLQLDFVPGPMSMIRGVRKLVGGEMLRIDEDGNTVLRRYVEDQEATDPVVDEADAIARFDALIRESVERQLVADVPVGIFLSGGIDSSIVARVASEVSREPVHTFSIGFEDHEFDESRHFDEVARSLGTIHHRRIARARDALGLVPRIAEITGEPVADGSLFPTHLLCGFARESVTVALSGDGADELFGGYPTYGLARTANLLSSLPGGARRIMERAAGMLPVSDGNLTFGYKARKFVTGLHRDPVARHHRWMGTFAPEALPRLLGRDDDRARAGLAELLGHEARAVEGMGPLEMLLRTDQRFYLQDQVLVKVDRASMANSLEVRPPFLSRPVVGFARSLPASLKVRGRTSKVLLRKWLARDFPASITRRPKKGFGAPLAKWFRNELRDLVGDVLSASAVRRRGLLEPREVTRLVAEHWTGRIDRRKEIFNLLALSLWLDYVSSRSGTI